MVDQKFLYEGRSQSADGADCGLKLEGKKPVQILFHEGQSYCIGLWWQTLPGGRSVAKKTIIKTAKEKAKSFAASDYNYVAVRTSQYGLGHFSDVPSRKTVSLAASLRTQRQNDSLIGIFNFGPELWWLCQISSGAVGADGDAWFTTEAEARNAFASIRQLLQTQDKELFFATPEASWKFLHKFLKPENPLVQLHVSDPSIRKLKIKILMAAILLVSLFAAFQGWTIYQEHVEEEERQVALAARKASLQAQLANAEQFFKKKWNDAPPSPAVGELCSRALLEIPLVFNGWRLAEADCKVSSLSVVWDHGRYVDFINLPPSGRYSGGPQKAVSTYALSKLPLRAKTDNLLKKDAIPPIFYQLAQSLSGKLVLTWAAIEKHQIDKDNTISAPWQACNFTLTQVPASALLSPDLFNALNFPGVVITSISRQNSIITIKGTIYGTIER
jgi:hypothetical protein